MFKCPVCNEKLVLHQHSLVCVNNHHYDVASEGYVNLLLANQKRSKEPGDPVESLRSREKFLEGGYYQSLSDELNTTVTELLTVPSCILDAGTGTGYYLRRLIASQKINHEYYAIDIGKEEVRKSTKKNPTSHQAVCSVFHLPLFGESIDLILSIFTPYSASEFKRVVRNNGYVIAVQPGKSHLFELKKVVYDNPYLNEEKGYDLPGFKLVNKKNVINQISLANNEVIKALWSMTPYAHKTSKEDLAKIDQLTNIKVTTDFLVSVYQKEEE